MLRRMSQELAHFCLPSRLSHGVGNWGTAAIGIVSMEEGSPIPGVGASRDRAPVRSPIIVGQVLEMLTPLARKSSPSLARAA